MTTADRDTFLIHIRQALKSSVLPDALAVLPPYAPPSPLPLDSASLVESFVREVHGVGGETFQPTTTAEAKALDFTHERLRSEEHTSELQSPDHLVCRLLLEK